MLRSRKPIIFLAAAVLVLLGSGSFAQRALAETVYFSNTASDGNWANSANWSPHFPASTDDAVVSGNVTQNTGAAASVANLTVNAGFQTQITIQVSGTATFTGDNAVNYGVIVGSAVFTGGTSFNAGTTTSAVFRATSVNYGTSTSATFYDQSANAGRVTGNATFRDQSFNSGGAGTTGTVEGDATFEGNEAYNVGVVGGVATFTGTDYARDPTNSDEVAGGIAFSASSLTFTLGTDWTSCTSASFCSSGLTWTFADSEPEWIFQGSAGNRGYINGNATFEGTTYDTNPYGIQDFIVGTITFTQDPVFNLTDEYWETPTTNWNFNGPSHKGTWNLYGQSGITTTVRGDVNFYDASVAEWADISGAATFFGQNFTADPMSHSSASTIIFKEDPIFVLTDEDWSSYTNNSATDWIFDGPTGRGRWEFRNGAMNNGYIAGDVTFYDSSYNYGGIISGTATFKESAYAHDPSGGGFYLASDPVVYFDNPGGVVFTLASEWWWADTTNWNFSAGAQWNFQGLGAGSEGVLKGDVDVYFPARYPLGGSVIGGTLEYHGYENRLYFFDKAPLSGDWADLDNWWTSPDYTATSTSLPGPTDNVAVMNNLLTNSGAPAQASVVTFYDNASNHIDLTGVSEVVFEMGQNYDELGTAVFKGASLNSGSVATSTFYGQSYNYGGSIVNATFNDSSSNSSGSVTNGKFYDSSVNSATVALGEFYDQSANGFSGTAGTAIFNDDSINSGTVGNSATFNGNSTNARTVGGSATFTGTLYGPNVMGPYASADSVTFSGNGVVFVVVGNSNWTSDASGWNFTGVGAPRWIFASASGGAKNLGAIKGNADCYYYPDLNRTLDNVPADKTVTYHQPVYFYNASGSTSWGEIGNWWTSSNFLEHPSSTPTAYDTVFLFSSIALPFDFGFEGHSGLFVRAGGLKIDGNGHQINSKIYGSGVNPGDDGFSFTLEDLDIFNNGGNFVYADGAGSDTGGGAGGTITLVNATTDYIQAHGGSPGLCGPGGAAGQLVKDDNSSYRGFFANAGTSLSACDSDEGGTTLPKPPKRDLGGDGGPGKREDEDDDPRSDGPRFAGEVGKDDFPPEEAPLDSTSTLPVAPMAIADVAAGVLKDAVRPAVITSGILAGASQLAAISSVASVYDIYLLILRGFGALASFLGIRRKRKPWGVVYDAVTKRPIDPAYVTVYKEGKKVASAITDIEGRYGFNLPTGTYQIKVDKSHYRFPSKVLKGKTEDEVYDKLYFGATVEAKEGEPIVVNIPMDPIGFDWNEYAKAGDQVFKLNLNRELLKARIYRILSAAGLLLAMASVIASPKFLNFGVLSIYILLILLGRTRIQHFKLVTIKRQVSGEPVPFAIVRVFMAGVEKEVKTLVADQHGRVYILVRAGSYYLTIDRKEPDGSYYTLFRTETRFLPKGVWSGDIIITQYKEEPTQSASMFPWLRAVGEVGGRILVTRLW